jgi:formamidopyrimidine-DNA glycosylase
LRSTSPTPQEASGRQVRGLSRLGKRIVLELEEEHFLVLHLMIAGRLHWRERGAGIGGRAQLAALDVPAGSLTLTEAGTTRRAGLWILRGRSALAQHDPGGIEPLRCCLAEFRAALTRENHTLKRALTDPHILAGIGNAYSDEILHRARLSPFRRSRDLTLDESEALYRGVGVVLREWSERLVAESARAFPEKVTAFREDMAVHGRYRQACPVCAAPVQRIVHASRESNYCARCQTGGRILADRALSRLLKDDWPRSLED